MWESSWNSGNDFTLLLFLMPVYYYYYLLAPVVALGAERLRKPV